MHESVDIVVARYRERVDWTRNVPKGMNVIIYDKGGDLDPSTVPRARVHRLDNIGYEAHTYLYHLVHHYDSLAPLTVFCQGHPFDHVHDLHKVLRRIDRGEDTVDDFRWLGFIIDSDDPRGQRLFVPWYKNPDGRELELDRFCRELLGAPAKPWSHFHVGAQFLLTAEHAGTRERSFYERALRMSMEFPDAGSCFERVWDRVFDVVGVDPAILDGALCRYLKRVRSTADGAVKVTGGARNA